MITEPLLPSVAAIVAAREITAAATHHRGTRRYQEPSRAPLENPIGVIYNLTTDEEQTAGGFF